MSTLITQILSFTFVGVIATAVHYGILIALVELWDLSPVTGSAIGAFGGAVVSYGLNRSVTFKARGAHAVTASRFFIVAVAALVVNTALMALFVDGVSMPYIPAQIVTTGLLVILTFGANKLWTFRETHQDL